MLTTIKQFFGSLKTRQLEWDNAKISDAWFAAHFNYAADVVAEWVGQERLKTSRVLDFGCGDGITALALSLRHHCQALTGIDISDTHKSLPDLARREIGLKRLPDNLSFQRIKAGEHFHFPHTFDVIMSWSTFEHIELQYLGGVLDNLYQVMHEESLFFLQINPLYYSPFGSHLSRFELEPWAHLLHGPDDVKQMVMDFKGTIPADETEENFHKRDFVAYKEFVLSEYSTLNKITGSELILHLEKHGFEVIREVFGQVAIEPPLTLLSRFKKDDLLTDEIRLLLRKRPSSQINLDEIDKYTKI